jgi:mannose-6-phosphate isomerase-like protein (cupin superfamily)
VSEMALSEHAQILAPGDGHTVDLGAIRMRVLAAGESMTKRAFSLLEFRGAEGPWTVPHIHRDTEESFFVLDGTFSFTLGDDELPAAEGSYVFVPRGTRHMITAGRGGGVLLGLMVPGGLEEMFFELGQLPADGITDPAVRAAISSKYDSVPA